MTGTNRWLWRVRCVLLASLLAGGSGCLSLHPVPPVVPEQLVSTGSLPKECRNRVYIFLLQGCDPFDCANLTGVTEHIQDLGFIKTYCGAWIYVWHFEKEIRRIHKEEPTARFVVLGFDSGANAARDLAVALRPDKIPIDLLVYLGGKRPAGSSGSHPDNVVKVMHIRGKGNILEGTKVPEVVDITNAEVRDPGLPANKRTLELLTHELTVVGARVPYVEKVPPRPPQLEQAPKPRPEVPEEQAPKPRRVPPPAPLAKNAVRDEWDFLEPGPIPPPTTTPLPSGVLRPTKVSDPASGPAQPTPTEPKGSGK